MRKHNAAIRINMRLGPGGAYEQLAKWFLEASNSQGFHLPRFQPTKLEPKDKSNSAIHIHPPLHPSTPKPHINALSSLDGMAAGTGVTDVFIPFPGGTFPYATKTPQVGSIFCFNGPFFPDPSHG